MVEIDDWKNRCQKLEYEHSDNTHVEWQIRDYESKIAILNKEIDRQNITLKDKIHELDGFRAKNQRLENNMKDRELLEEELCMFIIL